MIFFFFLHTDFGSWRVGERERPPVSLSRLSPVTSEQPLPGAKCPAMSPIKPHHFILAQRRKNPLILQPWTNFSFLFSFFYGGQWATLEPLNLSVSWDINTRSHLFPRLLEAEMLMPSGRTTFWLAAFCLLYVSFVSPLAEVGHHKTSQR